MTQKPKFKKTQDQIQAVKLMIGSAVHVLLFGGSRSGKTFIIIRQILLRAIKAPGSRHCILRKTQTDIRKSIWLDTLPKVLELCFPGVPIKKNEAYLRIILPNKSEIWLGGLDKTDKILGNEYATMYFNEISEISYEQVETAHSRLAQKCPELVNKFFYDCNPPSKSHWSYKVFNQKVNPVENTPLPRPELYTYMRLNPDGNKENLADGYIETTLEGMSERKKKRFLRGEWADDNENALWKRDSMINPFRVKSLPPDLERIVVAVDPAVTSKETSDHTGIVIAGSKRFNGEKHYYVLDDRSLIGTPKEWASTTVNAYREYFADRVVAEVNQGGDLVEATLRNIDKSISYRGVRASRGKILRAEPIAELYERGLVHHVGSFPLLEDEMCSYCGFDNEQSPDRLDALVWALTELSHRAGGFRAILA
jgi:phage terminase large subunit-like protein